jgi:hypothetical protein
MDGTCSRGRIGTVAGVTLSSMYRKCIDLPHPSRRQTTLVDSCWRQFR